MKRKTVSLHRNSEQEVHQVKPQEVFSSSPSPSSSPSASQERNGWKEEKNIYWKHLRSPANRSFNDDDDDDRASMKKTETLMMITKKRRQTDRQTDRRANPNFHGFPSLSLTVN